MGHRIPLHLTDDMPRVAAHRLAGEHAIAMMSMRPDGGGFRVVPDKSSAMSIVERHFVAAGDMDPPKAVSGRARRVKQGYPKRLFRP